MNQEGRSEWTLSQILVTSADTEERKTGVYFFTTKLTQIAPLELLVVGYYLVKEDFELQK